MTDPGAARPEPPDGAGSGTATAGKKGPPPVVAPLTPAEQDELASYLAGGPDEPLDARAWRRRMHGWWDDNPSFSAGATARGFTMRADGRIVGFFGVVPLGLQVAGKATVAYGSTTWRVDAPFRPASLSGIAKVLGVTKGSLLFVSTHTPALVKILQALKFVRLPRNASFAAREPNTLPLAVAWLARSPAEEIVLRGASAFSRLYPRLAAAGLGLVSRGLEVEEVPSRDALDTGAVDALWTRTRHQSSTTNVRDGAYVAWQCFAAARRKKLFLCRSGRDLVGLAIVTGQTARGGRLRIDQVADLWVDAATPRATRALLRAVIRSALVTRADLVELPTFSASVSAAARRAGFLPRTPPDRGEWVLGPKDALESLAADDAYLTLLQGDAGL